MTKTPITLQDLRRRLYVKAKAEPSWRFWGLYSHVCKRETLRAAYQLAKQNDGAPGTDGVTFEAIEVDGVESFLDPLREELVQRGYRPQRPRKVGIPKEGGKVRQLSIPSIRDRVVQGALKLILEPIFEADFQPGSFGYRPKKSAHAAVRRVSEAILVGKTYIVDLDLKSYFDTVRHHIVLAKVARRVRDDAVLWLLSVILKASGRLGVPARWCDFATAQQCLPHRGGHHAGTSESRHPRATVDEHRIRSLRGRSRGAGGRASATRVASYGGGTTAARGIWQAPGRGERGQESTSRPHARRGLRISGL